MGDHVGSLRYQRGIVLVSLTSLVNKHDIDKVRRRVGALFANKECRWGILFSSAYFDSKESEEMVCSWLFDKGCASYVSVVDTDLSIFSWIKLMEYGMRNPKLDELVLRKTGPTNLICKVLAEHLGETSIRNLNFVEMDVGEHTRHMFGEIRGMIHEMILIDNCSSDVHHHSLFREEMWERMEQLRIGWDCVADGGNLVRDLLDRCPRLRVLILVNRWGGEIDIGSRRDALVSVSVHPCIKHIYDVGTNEEMVSSFLHSRIEDKRRGVWRSGMAFMNIRIKRLSHKSAMRKLFADVDRLVWGCLLGV